VFFRRSQPVDERLERWRSLAERLELTDAADVAERVRRWLDLDVSSLGPIFTLRREGLPAAYLFDAVSERRGPSGVVRVVRTTCMVRSDAPITRAAFRASPRQDKVLESLQASRSGAVRLEVPSDPAFDADVSVYARDADGVALLLTTPVRSVLRRLLVERAAPDVGLVVGEHHVVTGFAGGGEGALVTLEHLLADTLSLVSLLPAVQRAHDDLTPDDLLDLG
jgi:hypothetical protein